jgi:hypothetical protein
MSLPLLFAGTGDPRELPADPAPSLAFLADVFNLQSGGRSQQPTLVGVDRMGRLHAVPIEPRHLLSPSVLGDLNALDAVRTAPSRTLFCDALFLFGLEHWDARRDTPGLNDPVALQGNMTGPFGAGGLAVRTPGTLTVTRADLLAGLLMTRRHALPAEGPAGHGHCFHLMLPADPAGASQGQTRCVLAYPMLPGELGVDHVANDGLVASLLHDLLGALKDELSRELPTHPLVNTVLPCPNRRQLEDDLRSDGWTIEGHVARPPSAGGKGLFKRLVGAMTGADRTVLPPEAGVDAFLDLARVALDALPESARSRTRAFGEAMEGRGVAQALHARWTPRPPPSFPPAEPPSPAPVNAARASPPVARQGTPDWMDDFGPAAAKAPRATPAQPSAPARAAPPRKPAPTAPAAPARDAPDNRPAWMKDFE